jgi:hypothetical protein
MYHPHRWILVERLWRPRAFVTRPSQVEGIVEDCPWQSNHVYHPFPYLLYQAV